MSRSALPNWPARSERLPEGTVDFFRRGELPTLIDGHPKKSAEPSAGNGDLREGSTSRFRTPRTDVEPAPAEKRAASPRSHPLGFNASEAQRLNRAGSVIFLELRRLRARLYRELLAHLDPRSDRTVVRITRLNRSARGPRLRGRIVRAGVDRLGKLGRQ